jgi:hypothetical protein
MLLKEIVTKEITDKINGPDNEATTFALINGF